MYDHAAKVLKTWKMLNYAFDYHDVIVRLYETIFFFCTASARSSTSLHAGHVQYHAEGHPPLSFLRSVAHC